MSREGRCNRLVGQTNQTGWQDLHIIRLSTRGFPLSKVKQNPALQSLLLFSNQSNWTQITVSFHFAGYAWKNKELSSHWDVRASGGLMEKWNDDIAMKVNIKCNSCDFPFKPFLMKLDKKQNCLCYSFNRGTCVVFWIFRPCSESRLQSSLFSAAQNRKIVPWREEKGGSTNSEC